MNIKFYVLSAFLFLTAPSVNSDEWVVDFKFHLEDGDVESTMFWISGFSYAVNAIGHGIYLGIDRPFCAPENQYIGSRELAEILNDGFAGKVITSQQATQEILEKLPKVYPC